ncbi:hypothetical protein SUGI_0718500 [Cryptomeria japonica]|nr:hypothetical protein SUGI_0718500 [Cryptomeria japonica]
MAKSGKCNREERRDEDEDEDNSQNWTAGPTLHFSFKDSENATNNFSNKLGSRGIRSVYEGTKIAAKRLDRAEQETKEFKVEVLTVGSINHLNLI